MTTTQTAKIDVMNRLLSYCLALLLCCMPVLAEAAPRALVDTNFGKILLELNQTRAPKTVANFIQYAHQGFYDNTVFHRVIDGFMIQGGGLTPKMVSKPTAKAIDNEADNGLVNQAYTVAMARGSNPNSATSQFFINLADNTHLNHRADTPANWGYAVFGRVVDGLDVVQRIGHQPTGDRGIYQNVPIKPVIIHSITILN